MKKIIIFGTGKIAEAVTHALTQNNEYHICAYVCDKEFITNNEFLDKPVIETNQITEKYPSNLYSAFIAIGYQELNSLRANIVSLFKEMGYELVSHICPKIQTELIIGENSIVMEDSVIQPCVKVGSNCFIWGGAMIGHHVSIEDNCWITGASAIGGLSKIGKNSFIGLNATIGNEIQIGANSMIGAGTICCRDLPESSVLVAPNTEPHRLTSKQFIRLSTCFRS